MITIVKGTEEHLDQLVPLFDGYRVFYKQDSDHSAAKKFLEKRIVNDESVVFLAFLEQKAVGFTQLFRSFSSVAMAPILILNDLYVIPEQRGKGIGEALLTHAKTYCQQLNFRGLALETAMDNPAQKLYERLGWEKDTHCFHYFWTAPEA